MSSPKICLILGAGASKPYGYPLGWHLKERIIQYCLSKPPYCAPPEKRDETWDKLEQFAQRFDDDASRTIDAFLTKLPKEDEFGRHGRMALAAVLSTYEHAYDTGKEWYDKVFTFWESKTDSPPLRVITFNYDRSFEFFLARSIEKRHHLSRQVARQRFEEVVEIEHVYGYIAKLPHFSRGRGLTVEYAQLTGHDLWKASLEGMQLIGDAMPDGDHISRTKQWIAESDYVIVLGFGFDPANVNLIGLDSLSAGQFLFCSGFKLSADRRDQVRRSCTPARVHFAGEDTHITAFLESSRLLSSAVNGEPVERVYAKLGPGIP